jgi:hypothetical protein
MSNGNMTPTTNGAVHWYKSQRFIALCQSTVLLILGWLIQALSTNAWLWRAIAISIAGNVLLQLKDWWSPTVIGPADFMNKAKPDSPGGMGVQQNGK